jgi:hypothetical protein
MRGHPEVHGRIAAAKPRFVGRNDGMSHDGRNSNAEQSEKAGPHLRTIQASELPKATSRGRHNEQCRRREGAGGEGVQQREDHQEHGNDGKAPQEQQERIFEQGYASARIGTEIGCIP